MWAESHFHLNTNVDVLWGYNVCAHVTTVVLTVFCIYSQYITTIQRRRCFSIQKSWTIPRHFVSLYRILFSNSLQQTRPASNSSKRRTWNGCKESRIWADPHLSFSLLCLAGCLSVSPSHTHTHTHPSDCLLILKTWRICIWNRCICIVYYQPALPHTRTQRANN